ncbi:MAG: dTMP kinase [Candidatus Omnitrophica bacterium]|nr:dTMP kinase [Candidatus Omnitrophota bacterium]
MEKIVKGFFITFEGSEGSGKSTQIQMVHQHLKKARKPVILLREPGGVRISEKIRRILLDVNNKEISKECETLLYMAARAQIVKELILPELKKGTIILCDRFLDSTVVYQGYGCGVDIDFINQVGAFVTQGLEPHLTLIFDIDAKKGLSRIARAKDRIELRDISYHNKVRKGYQELGRLYPDRVKLIESDQSREDIFTIVMNYINQVIKV